MKRFRFFLVSLVLVFALTACGGSEVPEDIDDDKPNPTEDYRAMALMRDVFNAKDSSFHMSFTTEFENDLMDVELYIKGDNIRMDSSDPEYGNVSIINNESGNYIVMHESKSYYKSMDAVDSEGMDFMLDDEDLDDYVVTTGQEEVNGTMYDFERLASDEDITTFYFVPGTDQWAALRSEETMMYIHKISTDVDDSIFKIPSGFEEMVM